MASSSTSSLNFKYDVFLSFRGEDTRTNFVDHLYDALKRENIETYKDDKNLERGKKISNELIGAIRDSRFHVIVFSKNYASSSWCLEELVKIMECQRTTSEHIVYPIFYNVEPTQVRKQTGAFGKAFAKHEKDEAVEKGRKALVEATSFSGRDLRTTADGHEVEFIKIVVKEISLKLPCISADENLIGMRTRINGVLSSLNAFSDEFCMVGIMGMGGIGKTTLAKAVFDQICNKFEGSSFVENVREHSNSLSLGLKSLQQQVLRDVLNTQDIIVTGVLNGKTMMKKKMSGRKVLVVLDDVDHIDQLKALAGEPNWFKTGSKIIITTRDKQVLIAHKVKLIHDVNLLTNDEAICLLSRCAFGTESPSLGYEKLSGQVVRYAGGLPLTITILGSSLCDASEDVWTDTLEELAKIPLDGTLQRLELSYMGLDTNCKKIFLDVACIIKGWKEDEAIRMLESRGFHAIRGLNVLEKKSLITISRDGRLDMHDHIQEMGRYIVRRSNLDEPRRHTRLWIEKEIIEILAKKLGTEATTCIYLFTSSRINQETIMKGLGNMKRLRFLLVHGFALTNDWELDEDSQYFPNSLQYLNWGGYPFLSLPKTFQASNLVVIEMCYSRLEQLWKGGEKKVLNKLRFLDLSHSMLKTLDLRLTPNIEGLNLSHCKELVEFLSPLGCLKLRSLNLDNSNLRTLDLVQTPNLEILSLIGCSDLVELYIPIECPKLRSLYLYHSKLRTLDLRGTPNLETLSLVGCVDLVELHIPIECLNLISLCLVHSKLRILDLVWAPNLKKVCLSQSCDLIELHLPVGGLKLIFLDLECSKLRTLDLQGTLDLETLCLKGCYDLVELHFPIECLKLISVDLHSSKLRTLDLRGALNIERLSLRGCYDLVELQMPVRCLKLEAIDIMGSKLRTFDLGRTPNLKILSLTECYHLVDLHAPFGCLKNIGYFDLSGCLRFKSFFFTQRVEYLEVDSSSELHLIAESIDICSLHSNNNLPKFQFRCFYEEHEPSSIGNLEKLISLGLCPCTNLESFSQGICGLLRLKKLTLEGSILEAPKDLDQLECLEEISLLSTKIAYLPGSICMLKHLKCLILKSCSLLEKLPEDLGQLECLEKLILSENVLLREIPNSVCKMKCLKYFHLPNCIGVEKLPEELGRLKSLKELNIKGTNIRHLPQSIFVLKGLRVVGFRWLLELCGLTSEIQTSDDETFCYI